MPHKKWIIRNIDIQTHERRFRSDIVIEDHKIVEVHSDVQGVFDFELDGTGKIAIPGLIDPHVHMELPIGRYVSSDDFYTGSVAAAFGGITTIIDFTTPFSGKSLSFCIRERKQKASSSIIDYALHATVCGISNIKIKEFQKVLSEGISSFKFFTAYKESNRQTTYAELDAISTFFSETNALMMIHAEDQDTLDQNNIFQNDDFINYARTRPPEAEAIAIRALAEIQKKHGTRVYIVHLSSKEGFFASRGSSLILETCPHYLVLDETCYRKKDGYRYAVAPPLRDKPSQQVLWNAIAEGSISTIGTDHCPFDITLKDTIGNHFKRAPFGLPGVETLLPILVTFGVEKGMLTWETLVRNTSYNPSKIFHLFPRKGTIAIGSDADIVILDMKEQKIDSKFLHSSSGWSPYSGILLKGRPELVVSRGEIIISKGVLLGRRGRGSYMFRTITG